MLMPADFEPYLSLPPSFSLLHPKAQDTPIDAQSLPAPTPFVNDEEYIACVEFSLNLQRMAFDAQDRARAALLEKGNESEKVYLAKMYAQLSTVAEKAHSMCSSRAELGNYWKERRKRREEDEKGENETERKENKGDDSNYSYRLCS